MPSKQDLKKIDAWKAKNVDRITVQPRKELKIPERLEKAVEAGKAASRQEYVINAVVTAFERDGVTLDE